MSETMDRSAAGTAGNDEQFFTLWTVFKRSSMPKAPVSNGAVDAFETLTKDLAASNVTLRGLYDVSAMRVDADVMVWLHGSAPEALQAALRQIRRSELFAGTEIAWSAMGVHRDAEFSKNHWPSFARGIDPETWICVYPFVRSYEWYQLPAEERGKMLRDHGMLGREFPQVLANTVASFALGDWEWILGLEAPNLVDLVDMMRHLRATEARNHVREEVPFYTGRRIPAAEVAEVLK
ncbi:MULTISPECIES: hydrogen peroxide-dependent heme synthase [unclassified Arthrobacter]|uniref:hydrogen peroxide-dependent heme synthase n=1 Tax=unclassified Arthrobacter TaxID=235627 RepID=UPI001D139864|nr:MULTISPECIES: hydrogen peroxide-dependent heme synthase [unclassified Arthrobacter]MCC3290413.1 chlorite dismutase family protein [Arthrobacter sp. zg-Y1110]MCC3300074.1 chlorite dismutase family protein [Arthrobacter sp. zg-Y895]MCC9146399.1 chlorite dismutase family protein [Arthrobacter sp. zg-Y919]MDK1277629.1 chlorite dismutase family protein [Arthrobacter sp. zg.Y919]MDM7989871.1 chlorite dismutase family protein [Arthrobacter sp. zg-Y877]